MKLEKYGCIPRVADTLYNPFGEDDDDFELNELINRSIHTFLFHSHNNNPDPIQTLPSWDEHRRQH